jgi:outer membrane autotransporter protein
MQMRKQEEQRLRKLICAGGLALSGAMLMTNSAEAGDGVTYTGTVTENIKLSGEAIMASHDEPAFFLGDVIIEEPDKFHVGKAVVFDNGVMQNYINVDKDGNIGNSTVQINGKIDDTYVALNNKESYWAGDSCGEMYVELHNGATWYVPEQFAWADIPDTECYYLSYGKDLPDSHDVCLNADGGIIDVYNLSPTKQRSIIPAGERVVELNILINNSQTGEVSVNGIPQSSSPLSPQFAQKIQKNNLNNATFAISTDVQNNKADRINLKEYGTNGSTYYVQVVYDAAASQEGKYDFKTEQVVINSDNPYESVQGKAATAKFDTDNGITTKVMEITPEIESSNDGTQTTAVIKSIDVKKISETAGTGTRLAKAAALSAQGGLAAWRAENNDLHKRMGDLRRSESSIGAWGRIYGGETEVNTDSQATIKMHGAQIGYDRKVDLSRGKIFNGFSISHMKGDVSGDNSDGDISSTLFGAYGSYIGEKGHFADVIIKYGRMERSLLSYGSSTLYESDDAANGLNMSIEYGYHKEMNNGLYLEPQAEINYGHINSSNYIMRVNGNSGAYVQNDAVNSLIGRLGVNIGKETDRGNIYAKLSILKEFSGDIGTRISSGPTSRYERESMKDTWYEYGIGFNSQIGEANNLYGEITKTAGTDKVSDKWKATIGLRHAF